MTNVLEVKIHRSEFSKSEVIRVDMNTPDIKRAVVVHYLASQDCIVVDLVRKDDPVYDRLARIKMNQVEVELA